MGAFMVGNERGGLTREQIDQCDSFVYIPQFGAGVGSLNVACACSVVLYQFTAWANNGGRPGMGVPEDPRPAMKKLHGAGSFPVGVATARAEQAQMPLAEENRDVSEKKTG